MGASPEARAQQAAKGAVEQAVAQQNELRRYIDQKTSQYETKALDALQGLESITGTKISDYIPQARKGFEEYTKGLTSEYRPLLEEFDPNLLGSPSAERLGSVLRQASGELTTGLKKVSEEGSARLYKTLAAPLASFTESSRNPAFNNLLNPEYMQLAKNPPTVASDVASMKPLYTYNV